MQIHRFAALGAIRYSMLDLLLQRLLFKFEANGNKRNPVERGLFETAGSDPVRFTVTTSSTFSQIPLCGLAAGNEKC